MRSFILISLSLFLSACDHRPPYECTLYSKRVAKGYEYSMGQYVETTRTDFVCIRYEQKKA